MENLVDILRQRGTTTPDAQIYTFLADNGSEETLTYAQLDWQARTIAAYLQVHCAPGERALLLYPPGLAFLAAFFGCLYAGVLAVPAYPPDPQRLNKSLPRLLAILKDASPTLILTTAEIVQLSQAFSAQLPAFQAAQWVATDTLPHDASESWHPPSLTPESLAFLQYTSGSTAQPKGVMISHGNLIYNEKVIQHSFQHSAESNFVSWLPQYHDMGLIGNLLQPLYLGSHCAFMPPLAFLKRPARWLEAITRFRAHTTGGPNFAYELCTHKITAEEKSQLDLSCWKMAYNGAEIVRDETLQAFYQAFQQCGLQADILSPVYGLAEATLLVSCKNRHEMYRTQVVEKTALQAQQLVQADVESPDSCVLVSCGHTQLDQEIRIVDPHSLRLLPERSIGEIWLSGPHIALGYWNNPEQTQASFQAYTSDTQEGPFFRTGDLGFLDQSELYITGRIKELIKIRGRSVYPYDLERSVESLRKNWPEIRLGCVAAFSLEVEQTEQLALMLEISPEKNPHFSAQALIGRLVELIYQEYDLHLFSVSLIAAGEIPKTSSGKLMRYACRDAVIKGLEKSKIKLIYHHNTMQMAFEIARSIDTHSKDVGLKETSFSSSLSKQPPLKETEPQLKIQTTQIQETDLERWLKNWLTKELKLPVEALETHSHFSHFGLDSVTAAILVNDLENAFGCELNPAVLQDYPSIQALAAYINQGQAQTAKVESGI